MKNIDLEEAKAAIDLDRERRVRRAQRNRRKTSTKHVQGSQGSRRKDVDQRSGNDAKPKPRSRKPLPVPIPANRSLTEIQEMDPDDPQFKKKAGKARKAHVLEEDTTKLSYREVVRREKQQSANRVRARARKAETVVAKAMEVHNMKPKSFQGEPLEDADVLIAEGILDMDDWDVQELARGYRRNRSGRFGTPPKYISREVQQEAWKRLIKRGDREMKAAYLDIIQEQIRIALEGNNEKVRLEAGRMIQERLVGKVPETLKIGVDNPWQDMLADSLEVIDEPIVLDLELSDEGVATMLPGEEPDGDGS